MFVTGPEVVKAVTHEDVSFNDLGGAMTHSLKSGVAHFAAETEEECLWIVRELLSFMPQNNAEDPPRRTCTDPIDRSDERLRHIVPVNPNKPYNIKDIITIVLDEQYFFEVQPLFAPNIVIGFGRLNGRPVGIIAIQPNY